MTERFGRILLDLCRGEQAPIPLTDGRVCTKCHTWKQAVAFGLEPRVTCGLKAECRECRSEAYYRNPEPDKRRAKEWTQKNYEHVRQLNKAWRLKNKDRFKALRDYYRHRDPEGHRRWNLAHPQAVKAKNARWGSENKDKRALSSRIRRARTRAAGGEFTVTSWLNLCERYGFLCLACGKKTTLHADHIVPVVLGGTSNIENIQPLCRVCNAKKGIGTTDYRPQPLAEGTA